MEFIHQIFPKFKSKYCANEDFNCDIQLDQLLYEHLNEPEEGIIEHRDTNSNFDKFLALGCFVGFEMLPIDEGIVN